MGIQTLQKFIEINCPGACVPVDLLKIARSVSVRRGGSNNRQKNKLSLVVDGECCLDRLYGGFFSDWVCGGQWNRMVQFLAVLIQTIESNNMELAVFFNGSLETQRMNEWIELQQKERKKMNQVLKHVNTKGTPPPKVWWAPPICLTTCLRMALRHLNITVLCTMDDHHQEVIAYCRENAFHGLMAEDAEYAIFDPPRYFSSEQLKLTYKGSLETKEFILDEVAKGLDLHPNRFCVFAALLGNYLLTEDDLADFYQVICPEFKLSQSIPSDVLIRSVCAFVRGLPSIVNLDAVSVHVFGVSSGDDRVHKFKQCVQYYLNGTKDGFLRYRPSNNARKFEPGYYPPPPRMFNSTPVQNNLPKNTNVEPPSTQGAYESIPNGEDPSRFASETMESELSSLNAYQEATGGVVSVAPQIVIEPPTHSQTQVENYEDVPVSNATEGGYEEPFEGSDGQSSAAKVVVDGAQAWLNGASSAPVSVSSTPTSSQTGINSSKPTAVYINGTGMQSLPNVPPEVMRTASERHQKGLMSPWIYQILSQGEIKIPVSIEEESPKEVPQAALFYRPIRQMVYAIVFNIHHMNFLAKQRSDQKKDKEPEKPGEVTIKEWVWTKNNNFKTVELVKAVPLGWAVPTVQRLWFGAALDDKKRRLRAFLTCLSSDTPLMLNTTYVPQHLLIMCCVLRYMVSGNERRILRKQELDAFLAQSVSPQLMDAQLMQNMQLPVITTRGIQLAALFMRGVECALFANDACGAPVPWLMCCPWLFFDGKLFHHKLLKANNAKNLVEICDVQISEVTKVERMRQAVLEGLQVEFARPPLPVLVPPPPNRMPPNNFPPPHHMMNATMGLPARNRSHGLIPTTNDLIPRGMGGRRGMLARGGQLEIAGVVVGSWGPNFGASGRGRNVQVPPQVTSVGGVRR
uniref:Constitutive coactivator of PPAR-gamma-like protein 1 n=1 Tax=Strigamia maritima TaxID=126957 RepID=T1INJ6_STRMM